MEPVVSLSPFAPKSLSAEDEALVENVASVFRAAHKVDQEAKRYADHVLSKMPEATTTLVLVDDLSAIDHVERIKNVGTYCSRAFTRARQNDIVLASIDPVPGFHDYMDQRLKLGNSHYVYVAPNDPLRNYHLFDSLRHDQNSQGKIIDYAPLDNDLVIHPYMGSSGAWDIASLLSEPRRTPVKVMAPLPVASKIANNKNDFLSIVKQVCGKNRTIDFSEVNTKDELLHLLEEKAKVYEKVVLRFPGSAGGMATEVLQSDYILNHRDQFLAFVDTFIEEYDWKEGSEKLQVSGWEPNVLMAPSSHLWIPPEGDKFPVFEEVLQQFFTEEDPTVFAGSRVATLPKSMITDIEYVTLLVGRVLQKLGYVGRCSFDLLLCGASVEEGVIKFVECNGRWGGASTPMTLMNRIFGDHRKHAYAHKVLQAPVFEGLAFLRFLDLFDDVLYDSRTGQGYAIVYNLSLLESSGQLDLITIGETQEEALHKMETFQDLAAERLS